MTKIKICGIKTVEASKTVIEEGADYIGLVFVDGVKRKISIPQAKKITDYVKKIKNRPKIVGLFRNQKLEYVLKTIDYLNLDCIQLCGNEDKDFFDNIPIKIFKQIRIKNNEKKEFLANKTSDLLRENIGVLLDTYEKKSLGGTGTSFDWNLADGIAQRKNTFLAGGLNNSNIDLAIKTCSPWGIDVSSGVESNGEKNSKLITSFIRKIKSTN